MAGKLPVIRMTDEAVCFGCDEPLLPGIVDRDDRGNLYHHNKICAATGSAKLGEMTVVNVYRLKYKGTGLRIVSALRRYVEKH